MMFHLVSPHFAATAALAVVGALLLSACGREAAPPLPDLVETLAPSVVNISAASSADTGRGTLRGSGFVWSADGHVITHAQWVMHATEGITVKLQNRHEYSARVIGIDGATQLALLKIEAPALAVVEVADLTQSRVGMPVVAISAPHEFDHMATAGILAARARSLRVDQSVPYLQTDAVISPGGFGGPLFDAWGKIIGVNMQMLTGPQGREAGVALAIPIDVAVRVAEQLRDHGTVRRAWLGLEVEGLDAPSAAALGFAFVKGARITKVAVDSPAAESGLRVGDVVLAIDGQPLNASGDLPPLVASLTAGAMASVSLIRAGREIEIRVQLGEAEPSESQSPVRLPRPSRELGQPAAAPDPIDSARLPSAHANPLGIRVAPLDAGQRKSIPLLAGGVRIVSVDSESAVRAGLRVDDLLLQVNGQAVNSSARFDEVVGRLTPESSVPLLVQRRGAPHFFVLDVPRRP